MTEAPVDTGVFGYQLMIGGVWGPPIATTFTGEAAQICKAMRADPQVEATAILWRSADATTPEFARLFVFRRDRGWR